MSVADAAGRSAVTPWQMPWAAWKQILKRVWDESSTDNLGLIAAGVAFYGFLSIVPALGAMLLTYGLFASPETLVESITAISKQLPENAAAIVGEQIQSLVNAPSSSKGWGLLLAIGLALYGATKGVDGLMTAVGIAYDEEDKRGFLKRTATVFALTIFIVLFALIALVAVSISGLPAQLLPTGPVATWAIAIGSAVLLTAAGILAAGVFFRFGPDRAAARWQWLTPGAILTGVLWLAVTSGFGFYVSRFDDYGATWGSLAGIVVLLTWLYLAAYVLLIGAELNAELEHQTAEDTTTGPERPLGERRAYVADNVAEA